MNTSIIDAQHYKVISHAIEYIRSNTLEQPSLSDIAEQVKMSEFHLQRTFTAWVGVSPKRYLQFLTKEHALIKLQESEDILTAAIDSGLSGTGRLHDLMVSCEAMSPGEIKSLGKNLVIGYGKAFTPFGEAFIAWTDRGICHFEFFDNDFAEKKVEFLNRWPLATITENNKLAADWSTLIFAESAPSDKNTKKHLNLVVLGTNFQLKVWEALLKTKPAQRLSYSHLAKLADSPKAQRAVGSALAANTIGYLIPCHRVIRSDGKNGHYRWGINRKIAIQAWEDAASVRDTD